MDQSRRDMLRSLLLAPVAWTAGPFAGITSIIDIHHAMAIEPREAMATGVRAIIHKATEGVTFVDKKYRQRKDGARAAGLLWGAYHFANNNAGASQARHFLAHSQPDDDDLVCLDFEHNKGNEMSLAQAEEFVTTVHASVGRFPVLYGGAWLREQVGTRKNELLSKCPLWYRRYAVRPLAIPTQIWPTFTLWQYTDGSLGFGQLPRVVNGLKCNRSFFSGTESDLRQAWPFARREA